jgi:hypothetical protein
MVKRRRMRVGLVLKRVIGLQEQAVDWKQNAPGYRLDQMVCGDGRVLRGSRCMASRIAPGSHALRGNPLPRRSVSWQQFLTQSVNSARSHAERGNEVRVICRAVTDGPASRFTFQETDALHRVPSTAKVYENE